MFIKKDREKDNNNAKSARQPVAVSTIAAGTTLNGDIEAEADMRVDGNIIGNVYCKGKIVLGESGIIQGNITAGNADLFGTVNGSVVARELLCLKAKCTVNGDVNTKRLQIEPNATFNGQCRMTDEVAAKAKSGSKVELEIIEN